MDRKKYFLIGLVFVVVFTSIFALFFKRDRILWSLIEHQIEKFEKNTSGKVFVRSFKMEGFSQMNVSGLVLLTPERDTFATVGNASVQFNLLSLLKFKAHIDKLELESVRLYPNDVLGNKRYSFLKSDQCSVASSSTTNTSQLSTFLRHYKGVLQLLPTSLSVSDVITDYYRNGELIRLSFPETILRNGQFESQVVYFVADNAGSKREQCFVLSGNIHDICSEESSLKIYSGKESSFPILLKKGDESISFSFDTLYFSFMSEPNYERWKGNLSLSSFTVDYLRLATFPIQIDTCSFDYNLTLNLKPYERLELDSASRLYVNGFELNPYLLYEKKDTLPIVYFQAKNDSFEAQRLFDALPRNVFPRVEGVKTQGNLSYCCSLDLDFNCVDSVRFHSEMNKKDFAIDRFGNVNFAEVNRPFLYHAYENGVEETSFIVGEDYPDFTPLDEISTYLKHAVLFSEDGLFYVHKGFIETAMNAALAKDLKEKRFARGGSTISMQLVKNLWLSREKTLSRKLEEALIVWLVENNRLISKDRMYEIYLNIIEWGPHIYGVKQATHFYFAKEPSELTPEEAIFMASVIPRPKKFMWFFDENRELKPFLTAYFDLLGDKLLKHDIITEKQRGELMHNVVVSGAAKAYLRSSVAELDMEKDSDEDHESALINVLDKAMNNEDISNGADKKN